MGHPAGESDCDILRLDFDRRPKLEFHGSRITSDAGLLAFRELDDAFGLSQMAEDFCDRRTGCICRHGMVAQFRQSVFGRVVARYRKRKIAGTSGPTPPALFRDRYRYYAAYRKVDWPSIWEMPGKVLRGLPS